MHSDGRFWRRFLIRYIPSEDVLYSPLVRERESTLSAVKYGVEPTLDVPTLSDDTKPCPPPISYADVHITIKDFPFVFAQANSKNFPSFRTDATTTATAQWGRVGRVRKWSVNWIDRIDDLNKNRIFLPTERSISFIFSPAQKKNISLIPHCNIATTPPQDPSSTIRKLSTAPYLSDLFPSDLISPTAPFHLYHPTQTPNIR